MKFQVHVFIDNSTYNALNATELSKSTNLKRQNGRFFQRDAAYPTNIALSAEIVTSNIQRLYQTKDSDTLRIADPHYAIYNKDNIKVSKNKGTEYVPTRIDRVTAELVITVEGELSDIVESHASLEIPVDHIAKISYVPLSHMPSISISSVSLDKDKLFGLSHQIKSLQL